MTPRARHILFCASSLVLAALLAWALAGLPSFGQYPGPYGDVINAVVTYERHVPNAITAVNFDYRGLDTMGEEFILFAAVTGVVLLLREERDEFHAAPESASAPGRARLPRSDAVRWMSFGLIGLIALFGVYIVLHAHLSPGGGFQGGAIVGTASLLIYLANDFAFYHDATPKSGLKIVESLGAGGYALIGLGSLVAGGAFLQNVLPLGQLGDLFSGGTIPLINFAVGLEVTAGLSVCFLEFLKRIRQPPPKPEDDKAEDKHTAPPPAPAED